MKIFDNNSQCYRKYAMLLLAILFFASPMYVFANGQSVTLVDPSEKSAKDLVIYVSIPPLKYFVHAIVPEADVISLVSVGQDAENYNPTAKQLADMANADIFVTIGMPYEHDVIELMSTRAPKLRIVEAAHGILEEDDHEEEEDDHGHGHENLHVWMSFEYAKQLAKNIYNSITSIANTTEAELTLYESNYQALLQEISETGLSVKERISPYKGASFLIYHPVLTYYAEENEIEEIAIQTEEGKEPAPQDLQFVYERAKETHAGIMLLQEGQATKSGESLAERLGISIKFITPLEEDWKANMLSITDVLVESFKK